MLTYLVHKMPLTRALVIKLWKTFFSVVHPEQFQEKRVDLIFSPVGSCQVNLAIEF
jgi:hypothetical protein